MSSPDAYVVRTYTPLPNAPNLGAGILKVHLLVRALYVSSSPRFISGRFCRFVHAFFRAGWAG